MNAAIQHSTGELVAVWDDDDISLPWRLETSVEAIGDEAYFNPGGYWFLDGQGLHLDHRIGLAHASSVFSRTAFDRVGGYPAESGAYDQSLDGRLRELGAASPRAPFGPEQLLVLHLPLGRQPRAHVRTDAARVVVRRDRLEADGRRSLRARAPVGEGLDARDARAPGRRSSAGRRRVPPPGASRSNVKGVG